MKKGEKKPFKKGPVSIFPLAEYGGVNYPAVFPSLTEKDLGISKSYYKKLVRRFDADLSLPQSIINKIELLANKKKRFSVPLYKDTKAHFKIPSSILNRHSIKSKKYVLVIFECSHRSKIFFQATHILAKSIKSKGSKQLNQYIDRFIKRYDQYPVYINQITFKSV